MEKRIPREVHIDETDFQTEHKKAQESSRLP